MFIENICSKLLRTNPSRFQKGEFQFKPNQTEPNKKKKRKNKWATTSGEWTSMADAVHAHRWRRSFSLHRPTIAGTLQFGFFYATHTHSTQQFHSCERSWLYECGGEWTLEYRATSTAIQKWQRTKISWEILCAVFFLFFFFKLSCLHCNGKYARQSLIKCVNTDWFPTKKAECQPSAQLHPSQRAHWLSASQLLTHTRPAKKQQQTAAYLFSGWIIFWVNSHLRCCRTRMANAIFDGRCTGSKHRLQRQIEQCVCARTFDGHPVTLYNERLSNFAAARDATRIAAVFDIRPAFALFRMQMTRHQIRV